MASWTTDDARRLYNLPYWSDGYFDLDTKGSLVVRPSRQKPELTFELDKICERLAERNLHLPALIRFQDIIHDRVRSLCGAFNKAILDAGYQNDYMVCYPIKVNQQRAVVEEIINSRATDQNRQVGLESGSKPELMAVLALSEHTNSVIVCNGYKDREYIRLALIGGLLGHTVYIVVEKLSELHLILDEADKLGVTPRIGVRARLATKGESKWQQSGGSHSKFGLSANQILELVATLKSRNCLDILQLLHFHLGSQITSIYDIQNGLKECARFYQELHNLGAPVRVVDVGGGLGIDYEGTRSQSHCSTNYTMAEYASNVVWAFARICREHDLPHPRIITESGRALTAHHAVLISNVIDLEEPGTRIPDPPAEDAAAELLKLYEIYRTVESGEDPRKLVEGQHNASYLLRQVHSMYSHGMLSLPERADAERYATLISRAVRDKLKPQLQAHEELRAELDEQLASKYFVNFSLFQSLPDAWAIEQIFPVLPLSGLDKEPTERVIIQDITCDSDGALDQYVDEQRINSTLRLPAYEHGNMYRLGFFLVGAYQEILGDLHNLFGDTHTVNMSLADNDQLEITQIQYGDSVDELLSYVDYEPQLLLESYRRQLAKSELSVTSQRQYLAELRQGISGYCYLED